MEHSKLAALRRRVVADAVDRKYLNMPKASLRNAEGNASMLAAQCKSEEELLRLARPVRSAADDILNQVLALELIEKFWARHLPKNPIQSLHSIAMGTPRKRLLYRKTLFVADFGGTPPTEPRAIQFAIRELELSFRNLVPSMNQSTVGSQAALLAHIFSSVIRIHPFEDGNGRVARLAVQLALRAWNLPYLPIPKVRNSQAWKIRLTSAIAGDTTALTSDIRRRLNRRP